jgi:hypothetical protein
MCSDGVCDPMNPGDIDCQPCDPNTPNCSDNVCDPMNPGDPDCACDPVDPNCSDGMCNPMLPGDPDCCPDDDPMCSDGQCNGDPVDPDCMCQPGDPNCAPACNVDADCERGSGLCVNGGCTCADPNDVNCSDGMCNPMLPDDPDCCADDDPMCSDGFCSGDPVDPDCGCQPGDPNCPDNVCDPMNPNDPDCPLLMCMTDADCFRGPALRQRRVQLRPERPQLRRRRVRPDGPAGPGLRRVHAGRRLSGTGVRQPNCDATHACATRTA